MAIVTARMHTTVINGAIRTRRRLLDRQCIHIGPQSDRTWTITRPQHANHTRSGDPAVHFATELGQLGRDQFGGSVFLEAEFRMGMNIAPPRRHLVVHFVEAIDKAHRFSGNSECIPHLSNRLLNRRASTRPVNGDIFIGVR